MISLDNKELQVKLDSEDMYHKIIHLPEQIYESYFKPEIFIPDGFVPRQIRRIVFAGMGGSAISGDLLNAAFSHIVPIAVYKDYHIPIIYEDDLFIACSYSGNTEETVNCLKSALKKTTNVTAVTNGGLVSDLLGNKCLRVALPSGFPPRSAIGHLFFSLLHILELFEICEKQEATVKNVVSALMMKAGAISRNLPQEYNLAKQAAVSINSKIPLIYSANPALSPIAYRWKCQINENSKYPAFNNTFPEMNHNEIEAWENRHFNQSFLPIFLSDIDEKPDYKKRVTFFKELLSREQISFLDFYAEGSSYLERAFTLIYLGDVISYYLAILQNVNPTSIDYIVQLKNKIS